MPPPTKKPRIEKPRVSSADESSSAQTDPCASAYIGVELIGHIAKFANFSGTGANNDLQNICVAVGRRHVDVILHTFLYKHYEYLNLVFLAYASRPEQETHKDVELRKVEVKVLKWMEVNTHWKDLVTEDRINFWQGRAGRTNDDLGDIYFAIFNNPVLMVSFDLVDVLQYLVEEKGLDVNGLYCFRGGRTVHLLTFALNMSRHRYHSSTWVESKVFDYLLSIDNIDVDYQTSEEDETEGRTRRYSAYQTALDKEIAVKAFDSIVGHKSFHPNKTADVYNSESDERLIVRPLHELLTRVSKHEAREEDRQICLAKIEALLKVGADPHLTTPQGDDAPEDFLQDFPSPITFVQNAILSIDAHDSNHLTGRRNACERALSLMRSYGDNRNQSN